MADVTISIDIDAKGTKTGADQAKAQVKGVTDQLKSAGSTFKSFGSDLASVGRSISLALTIPIVAAGASVLKAGADYEKALNIFQAVTKATTAEMQRAADVSRALGADLTLPATSAKDAALAMNELGKAGLTAAQAIDAAKGVLQLAAAGAMDEARAAEIAANALNAFHLEAKETTRVADLLAAAANASSAEVDDVALSLQQASAVAAAAKIPIEDLVTAISAMANAGVKGSDAGTSLKEFLLKLEAPMKNAKEAMKEYGISVFDTAGKLKSLPEIIDVFGKALAGLTDEQKAGVLNRIFGSDAIRAAQILFATGTDGFNKLKEQVTATGAAADLANARMKGLSGAWEGFKSQLETVGIQLFEIVKTPLTNFLQTAATLVGQLGDAFSNLPVGVQQAVIVFAALLAAIGPLLVIFGSLISAIGAVIGLFTAAGGAIPIAAAAIAALTVELSPLIVSVGLLYAAWQTNFGGIRELTTAVASAVVQAWHAAMSALSELTSSVLAEVQSFWAKNKDDILAILTELSNTFKSIWTAIAQFWEENGEAIKVITNAVWVAVKEIIVGVVHVIGDALTIVIKLLRGDWAGAWEATKDLIATVAHAWGTILISAGVVIVEAVKTIAANIIDALANGLRAGVNRVSAAAREVADAIPMIVRQVMIIHSPSKVMHELGGFITQGLADGIKEGTAVVIGSANTLSNNLKTVLNKLFGGDFKGFLNSAFSTLTDSSKSFGDRLRDVFHNVAQNFRSMVQDMLSTWLNSKIFGGAGGSGGTGLGPGGTPYFNPNGGGEGGILGSLGGGSTGTGQNAGGGFGFGKGQLAGTLGAIGGGAQVIGQMIGGRAGGFISNIGTGVALGAQIGSIVPGIGTVVGAVVGGAIGFLASIFGGDPKRKHDKNQNIPALSKGFGDAITQLNDLLGGVKHLTIDPDSAIQKAAEIRAQIASGFGIQFESKKYSKIAQQMIASKLAEADALIDQIKHAAEVANAANARDRRILPEFASGVFLSPALQAFRRRNGMLGGSWTGIDSLPSMLAPGEMVLNPYQQERVRRNAGGDVFQNAGIPGYAGGGVAPQPSTVVVAADQQRVEVQISLQQDASGMWTAAAKSPSGRKVLIDLITDASRNRDLKLSNTRGA